MENAERVLARMEQLGAETVRDMISSGRWPANYRALALEWLRGLDNDAEGEDAHREAPPEQDQHREQTAAPEEIPLTETADASTRNGAWKFWGVSLLAMIFIAPLALWGASMRHADRPLQAPAQAKSSTAIAKIARVVARPAPVEADEHLPPAVKHPGYTDMTLRDLILDQGKLVGHKVRVTGLYQQMEDITLLAASGDDMNPIDLDIAGLPRKERSALLDCPNRDCRFQVEGKVRMNRSGVIVRADDVQEIQEP